MKPRKGEGRIGPRSWATMLVLVVICSILLSWFTFQREFTSYATVLLTSDRAGLMMEPGGKVKLRGVEVGRIGSIVSTGSEPVSIELEILPDQLRYIPANIEAQITASTAFGAKFVDLVYPPDPSAERLAAGAVLRSANVSTEVNTVFDNLVTLLRQIDPAKLNGILSALAEGLRGRGERIGQATTDASQVLAALNSRSDTIAADWRALAGFSETYGDAAQNILSILDSAATTSETVVNKSSQLQTLLLSAIGLADTGTGVLAPNRTNLIDAINVLEPTTRLLETYSPSYTCLFVGAKWYLDNAGYIGAGGNGRSVLVDAALLFGNDPYVYPDNLPIVAAQGGPGGQPGCGSLPDASQNFPVRALVTNTGWGTGMDLRPNPGLGHPCFANYFPVTRAVPGDPTYRCVGLPSPGLAVPAPGPLPLPPQAPPAPEVVSADPNVVPAPPAPAPPTP